MERKPESWRWIVVILAFLLVMGAVAVMGGIVEAVRIVPGWLDCPPPSLSATL